ncbi:MAG: polysaccharide biosynthesis C-terminal domain-containing protein [Oscillospiraceae bacterium]|nr:polysaccharide biosynthesis C-terminal domain-containing protein [Oscillospiraceae bacterium]
MNVLCISEKQIARDAVKMTLLSLAMQTAAMVFNAMLSDKAGTAAVGLMSLIFSLFGFIMVLANGNILTSTSRFVSEARGAGHRNYSRVMRYSLTFSFCLSMSFGICSFLSAELIGMKLLHSSELTMAVRFIALSLPFASAGSCIKGYFHGIRRVDVPMRGDLIEFAAKWAALFSGLLFFGGTELFYAVTAASILLGEFISFLYYAVKYSQEYKAFRGLPPCSASLATDTPSGYLKGSLPILVSGYVQMLMSTANELLVPAALLKYSRSAEEALSCYGCFEALIMPAVFFPSAVLTSLSGIIVPEAALANRCEDPEIRRKRLSELTDGTFRRAFTYAFFISAMFLLGGETAGRVLCPQEELVSRSLVILAPVIPFIYLEIVLEGLLKGMGRQNFSTVNSLFEYAVRIGCVMIFVGKIGFGGVLISYYASNVISNIARIIVVCREAGLRFDPMAYVICPLFKGLACCGFGTAVVRLSRADFSGELISLILFVCSSAAAFALLSAGKRERAVR